MDYCIALDGVLSLGFNRCNGIPKSMVGAHACFYIVHV